MPRQTKLILTLSGTFAFHIRRQKPGLFMLELLKMLLVHTLYKFFL